MIPILIDSDATSLNNYIKALEQINLKIGNIEDIRDEFVKIAFEANRLNILTQGQRLNNKYDPLSPDYEQYKKKVRPGRPINIFDQLLFDTVTGEDQSTVNIFESSSSTIARRITIEFINNYLEYVQRARVVIGLNDDDERNLADSVEKATQELFTTQLSINIT